MPSLVVLKLSDSFSAAWVELAEEYGLTLEIVVSPPEFDRHADAIGIVAAGGEEGQLEATLRQICPIKMDVAAIGALANHRLAIAVVRAGASEFFALTDDYALLRSWVHDRADRLRMRAQREVFADGERAKYNFDGILGESPALLAAVDAATRVVPHRDVTVLVTGETGSGKELVARALHYSGPRREAPFVDVNCAAIPDRLLETELFGRESGADADASFEVGLFEHANGGTLFLDEVGHLPLRLQVRLLRALEEKRIRRVGGMRSIPVDVRVVAATNVDLLAAVQRGEFREDLYYRLNVVAVDLPPLRARRGDVAILTRHFLARFASDYGMPVPALTPKVQRQLADRDWPGNVRELRNTMERAILLGPEIFDARNVEPTRRLTLENGAIPFPARLDTVVYATALAMLALCGDNKSHTARRLGISRTRLQRVLDGGQDDEVFVGASLHQSS
ncbi:MAG: sigma-54 dependent transcriptional regulator [bacterium]